MSRELLLVAGSGRSGTSLFASIVGNLGFYVPRPLIEADASNPRGFGEPQWVVNKHTALLRQANVHASDARPSAWADTAMLCLDEQIGDEVRQWLQNQFSGHDQLVIKDPRLLWFLPLWDRIGRELGANVHVVTMLRYPAEVVSSKLHWYSKMDLADANRVAGWVNTMLFTERATREYSRYFVRFEDLLEDWTQQIARVSAHFDIPSLVNARAREQAAAAELVDHSLRRSVATWETLDVPKGLVHLTEKVWENLLVLADPEGDRASAMTNLDEYREEYITFYSNAEKVAQSTTMAAVRPLRQKKAPPQAQKPPLSSQAQASEPIPTSLSRARRLIPSRVRNVIPLRLKRALFEMFG